MKGWTLVARDSNSGRVALDGSPGRKMIVRIMIVIVIMIIIIII